MSFENEYYCVNNQNNNKIYIIGTDRLAFNGFNAIGIVKFDFSAKVCCLFVNNLLLSLADDYQH